MNLTVGKKYYSDKIGSQLTLCSVGSFSCPVGGTAAAAPPPSGLATLPSVGAVP